MSRPTFGQRVIINAEVVKRRDYSSQKVPGLSRIGWPRRWERRVMRPREGIYIGYRKYQDVLVWWEDDETGNVCQPIAYHDVWLIVVNERMNPIPCFPEDVELKSSDNASSEV